MHHNQKNKPYTPSIKNCFFKTLKNTIFIFKPNSRGAAVEWLERLGYGAEKRRKVVSSRLGFAIRRLESSLCQSNSKWVPSSNQRRIRQQKEKDGLCLSSAVPKIAPMSLRLLGYGKPLYSPIMPKTKIQKL